MLCDLLFKNATILTFAHDNEVLENVDIVTIGNKIVHIESGEVKNYTPKSEIDASNLIIIPGLINAHTHSGEALKRGTSYATQHGIWISNVWKNIDSMSDEKIEVSIKLCAAEMIRGGVTTVIDHFRQSPLSERCINTAVNAWLNTGMRATLALMVRDQGLPDWLEGRMPPYQSQISLCRESLQQWTGNEDLVRLGMGPSAPTRCSLALLKDAVDLTRSHSTIIHMHCDETEGDRVDALNLFGKSAVEYLSEFELLDSHVSLAHANWVSESDVNLLAKSGAAVVHNPVSNLRLGSGRAPIESFIKSGIPILLGTDGAASNDSQNILEALKIALILPRIFVKNSAEWPSIKNAIDMVVRNASIYINRAPGKIEVGANADFVAFNKNELSLLPMNDLYSQLFFSGTAFRAKYVVINGELILNNGRIMTFDENDVIDRARSMSID